MRSVRLVTLALLAGCLAPKHVRPELPVDAAWPAVPDTSEAAAPDPAPPGTATDAPLPEWRAFFREPRLQALIATALENNRDLRITALNIERARALYRFQRADRLPSVGVSASATTSHGGFLPDGTFYQVGLAVPAFELDYLGRVANLSVAARAEYLATAEASRAAQITLVGDVVSAYLAERSAAEQLALARQTVAARTDAQEIARQRFEGGVASELDLRQSETLLETARVSTAVLARNQAQAANALVLLVGAPAVGLPEPGTLADQEILADIPPGLPSDLLERRPDVLAAEQRLRAAGANIGAARAAFFPQIMLTGSVGTQSTQLAQLFGAGTGLWSFVPSLFQPIFEFGRNRANLRVAEVDRDVAVADYERTVQVAFREVSDALVARGPLEAQVQAQERLRVAEARRLELADQRYREGASGYLELLDAQRSLFDAEQSLIGARQLRLANAVDLYRALGGGFGEQTVGAAGAGE